jgi:hypothetical protein
MFVIAIDPGAEGFTVNRITGRSLALLSGVRIVFTRMPCWWLGVIGTAGRRNTVSPSADQRGAFRSRRTPPWPPESRSATEKEPVLLVGSSKTK